MTKIETNKLVKYLANNDINKHTIVTEGGDLINVTFYHICDIFVFKQVTRVRKVSVTHSRITVLGTEEEIDNCKKHGCCSDLI